jgi:hypothetical protein
VMNSSLQIFWLKPQLYSAFSVLTGSAERYGYITRGRFVAWSVINDSRFNSLCTCMCVQFHLWVFCAVICSEFLKIYLPFLYELWHLFHVFHRTFCSRDEAGCLFYLRIQFKNFSILSFVFP